MTDSPIDSLRATIVACESVGAAYAVIGAVARNAWAPPRATTDLDLAVSVTLEEYRALLDRLSSLEFEPQQTVTDNPQDSLPDVVLLRRPKGSFRRLDLLVAKSAFEREAVEKAEVVNIGVECRVVTPEHLIVYKLIAGRPRDLGDAEDVLRTQSLAGRDLDIHLVRKWVREWSVEPRLDALLERITSSR